MRACGAGIWTIYACVESVWARFQHRKGGTEEEGKGILSVLFFI